MVGWLLGLLAASGVALATERVALPGSEVSLPAEPGFVLADTYVGVWHPGTDASVMVTKLPGPAAEVVPQFTPEALAGQGLTVGAPGPVTLDGRSGVWFEGTQQQYRVWLALVGDSGGTWLIKGTAKNEADGAPLVRMMRGATWGAWVPPRLAFAIEVPDGMAEAGTMQGALYFGPANGNGGPGEPMLAVAPSVRPLPAKVETARAQFERIPGVIGVNEDEVRDVVQGGMTGWDLQGHGLDAKTGDEMVVWQRMLFRADGSFYRMVGMAPRREAHRWVRAWEKAAATLREAER